MAMGSALALELRRGTIREEEDGRFGETARPVGTRPALRKRLPEDRGAVKAAATHSVDEMARMARSGERWALILFLPFSFFLLEALRPSTGEDTGIAALMPVGLFHQV